MPDRLNRRILIRSVVTLVAITAVVGALFAVDAKTDIISSALHIPAARFEHAGDSGWIRPSRDRARARSVKMALPGQ